MTFFHKRLARQANILERFIGQLAEVAALLVGLILRNHPGQQTGCPCLWAECQVQ